MLKNCKGFCCFKISPYVEDNNYITHSEIDNMTPLLK